MVTKPEKYTQEYVLAEVQDMLKETRESETVIYKKQLFTDRDYTYQRFSEWAEKFKDDREISDTIRKIGEIIETRNFVQAANRDIEYRAARLNLGANYGLIEKTEVANTGNTTLSIEVVDAKDSTEA